MRGHGMPSSYVPSGVTRSFWFPLASPQTPRSDAWPRSAPEHRLSVAIIIVERTGQLLYLTKVAAPRAALGDPLS